MRTIVTTHPEYSFLLDDFKKLADKFYPWEYEIDIAQPGEAKSDQLIRLCSIIEEGYFILLEEDFFFVRLAPVDLVDQIIKFCKEKSVDRFSLQSKIAHSYNDWPKIPEKVGFHQVYKTCPEVPCLFSLEASIWKRSFLLAQMELGQSDQEIEQKVSDKIRHSNHKMYALEHIVLHYRDAMRDMQHNNHQIIHLKDNPLRLTVQPGNESALYPLEDDHSTELLLT